MRKLTKLEDLLAKKIGEEIDSAEHEKFIQEYCSLYFGKIIKDRRKKLCMSQEKLAKKIGRKRSYISIIEKGEDDKICKLFLLANVLGLSICLTDKE